VIRRRTGASALRLRRAVKLVWAASPGAFLGQAVLWIVLGLAAPAALLALKRLVDALALPGGRGSALSAVGLLALAALVTAIGQSVSGPLAEAQAQRVADHVGQIVQAKSIGLDLEYYDDPHFYDILHRAQQEAPYRPFHIVQGLTRVGQGGLALAGTTGLLLSMDWRFAVVVFAAAAPGAWIKVRASRALHAWRTTRTEDERRAWYYQSMVIDGAYAKEARVFGFGPTVSAWFRDLRARMRGERESLLVSRAKGDLAAQVLAVAPVFALLASLVSEVFSGRRSVGDVVLFYAAIQRGLGFLQEMMSGLAGLYEDNLFLASFFEFLDLPSRLRDPAAPRPVPAEVRHGLVVDGVTFSYPRAERPALEAVDIRVRPGEVIALVGENGAGKTTLVKLLCRLYDPSQGTISLDGAPIDQFEIGRLRRLLTVGFQDFARYHLTARENIVLGDVDAPPSEPRLAHALRMAGAAAIVDGLPRGRDTVLGPWLEGGHELSAGQWQRIALARTLWREAWLVILDEPTSAMDPEAEDRFWEELRPALEGRAALLISHRFSTVRQADRIYVMEAGRVIEQGGHEELLARGGTYARMFTVQARYYR
jgi:ATP-binding cassette subfamily B protein